MSADAAGEVRVVDDGAVRRLTLARAARRNALTPAMMRRVTAAVVQLPSGCRLVVLRGAGPSFCAGADLQWMGGQGGAGGDGRALAEMFAALAACDRPLLVVAHGAVRGGGCGLVAVADVALAAASASFAFPEVRLGLAPAVIAPHVLSRVSLGAARAAFLRAEPFDAARALALGLVDEAVADDVLEIAVARATEALLAAGPRAVAETKALLGALAAAPPARHARLAAEALGRLRGGEEARAGIAAFFARRPAPWSEAPP